MKIRCSNNVDSIFSEHLSYPLVRSRSLLSVSSFEEFGAPEGKDVISYSALSVDSFKNWSRLKERAKVLDSLATEP